MYVYNGVDGVRLHLVSNKEEWDEFYKLLMSRKLIACDTETSGFDWYNKAEIIGLSFGWEYDHYYIPLRHVKSLLGGEPSSQIDINEIREDLRKFFAQGDVFTLWHNFAFDASFYLKEGIEISTPFHDTRILWQLFDENAPGALKTIASGWTDLMKRRHEGVVHPDAAAKEKEIDVWRAEEAKARRAAFRKIVMARADELETELQFQSFSRAELKTWIIAYEAQSHEYYDAKKDDVHYGYIPISLMCEYAALDTFLSWRVYKYVIANLPMSSGLQALYINELKLSRALLNAQLTGMAVDKAHLLKAGEHLSSEAERLIAKIKQQLGDDININSVEQLADALMEQGVKLSKLTETGKIALDKKVLDKLKKDHEVVQDILEYRKTKKLKSTYVDSILDKLVDGRILHCTFNQNVSTGRMCIAAGTPVLVLPSRKHVLIEDVKEGDLVFCYTDEGKLRISTVQWAGCKGVKETVVLTAQGDHGITSVTLTPDHRVRCVDGWEEAQQLAPGDALLGQYGTYYVESVVPGPTVPVYDLEVKELHNFIAGELCVHNSSREPNMQNIPAKDTVIRRAFVPPSPDYYYVFADYSQIEVRLTAHYSQDILLLDAYAKNQDIHTRTMCEMFDIPLDLAIEALKDETHPRHQELDVLRTIAKRLVFGIIYGVSPEGLAEQVLRPVACKHLDEDEWVKVCKDYIDTFLFKYIGVKRFVNNGKRLVRANGQIINYFGRVRHLPHINATKIMGDRKYFWMEGRAERQGVNAIIQSTAADLFKTAVVRVHEILKGKKSKIVNFVHDEMQFYMHKDELHLLKDIKKAMEDFNFIVPIIADFSWSTVSWADKLKLDVSKL